MSTDCEKGEVNVAKINKTMLVDKDITTKDDIKFKLDNTTHHSNTTDILKFNSIKKDIHTIKDIEDTMLIPIED